MRFKISAAVHFRLLTFWLAPCSLKGTYQHFGETFHLCLQGKNEDMSYETLVPSCEITVLNIKYELAVSSNGITPILNLTKIHSAVFKLKHVDTHNQLIACYSMYILQRMYMNLK
jgi:hypothetical protein